MIAACPPSLAAQARELAGLVCWRAPCARTTAGRLTVVYTCRRILGDVDAFPYAPLVSGDMARALRAIMRWVTMEMQLDVLRGGGPS